MYDDGYTNITNIDISGIVIKQMTERNVKRVSMKDEIMDVRDIKYPDNHFDLAIDKSTIDALLCGDEAFINVAKMTKEIQRTLKVGAAYMVISYGKPENRILHFVNSLQG
jgi:ubiquinone/menaquinone biosynthesis C-methylase UbiE